MSLQPRLRRDGQEANMDRRSLSVSAVLATSITLSCILIAAPLNAAQQRVDNNNPNDNRKGGQRATQPPTAVVPSGPTPYTGQEARKYDEDAMAVQRDLATSSRSLAADTKRLSDYTFVLILVGVSVGALEVVVLVLQVVYTGRAANAAKAGADAALLAQRAYIDMSHHPPGLEFDAFSGSSSDDPIYKTRIRVSMAIKNSGTRQALLQHDWSNCC